MKNPKINLLIISAFLCNNFFAQSVGINSTGTLPNGSALLDVDAAPSNDKGLLIPRIPLTATNNNAPIGAGIANSLLVFNTATVNDVFPGYYYWNGTQWVRFINAGNSSGGDWALLGNAGTNPSVNFLGTTDNQDLVFRTNNLEQARITAAGLVGVGTNNPLQKLHLSGTSLNLRLENTSANTFDLNSTNAGDFRLINSSNVTIPFTVLGINDFVGIGTTIPSERLEINGNTLLNDGNNDGPRLIWRGGTSASQEYRARIHSNGWLGFFPAEVGNPNYIGEPFRIFQNGRVVVGDQLTGFIPSEQFTVTNGNFQLGEATTVPGVGREIFFGQVWENTDLLSMRRENLAFDVSELVMYIGDNFSNSNDGVVDRFVIKSFNASTQLENIFSVQGNGPVRVGLQKVPTENPTFTIDNERLLFSVSGGFTMIGNYNNDPSANQSPGYLFTGGVGSLVVGMNRTAGTSGVDLWNNTKWNAPLANQNSHRGFYFRRYDQAGNEQLLARIEGTGDVFATAFFNVSDKRIKKDVTERKTNVLDKLVQLKTYNYTLRNQYHLSDGNIAFNDAANSKDFGVIAQELSEIFPELVHQPSNENKELWAVDYAKLSVIAIEAIKEQQIIINKLIEEIEILKSNN
ncbi:MAG: tail fiber domain-containing protein [Vicingaceae bacterium]|nr:tail fiber domain-containing protein [Vicingaceae bacterium]